MSVYVLQVKNATPAVQAQVEAAFRKDPKAFAANVDTNLAALGLGGDHFDYALTIDGAPTAGHTGGAATPSSIALGADQIPVAQPDVSRFAATYNQLPSSRAPTSPASAPSTGSESAASAAQTPALQAASAPSAQTAALYPSGAPKADDVGQGAMNDCALDSQLAGLAHTNPAFVQNMIHASPSGGYDVTLFPNGVKTTVNVTQADVARAQTLSSSGQKDWASVIEVATIKAGQDYTHGADPTQIAQLLTGERSTLTPISSLGGDLGSLEAALASGKSVTASASVSTDKVHQHHGYTVLDISGDEVSIRNPVGGAVQTLSKAEFLKSFDAAFI